MTTNWVWLKHAPNRHSHACVERSGICWQQEQTTAGSSFKRRVTRRVEREEAIPWIQLLRQDGIYYGMSVLLASNPVLGLNVWNCRSKGTLCDYGWDLGAQQPQSLCVRKHRDADHGQKGPLKRCSISAEKSVTTNEGLDAW